MNILLLQKFNHKSFNLRKIFLLFTLHSVLCTLYLLLSTVFTGCVTPKKAGMLLTSEPSMERAIDILSTSSDGERLVKFLVKNPVLFEYSNTEGDCHKFDLAARRIYLSRNLKDSELLLTLAIARAGYVYKLYLLSGLDRTVSEHEEIASLFQSKITLQMNAVSQDFENAEYAREMYTEFCTYIMEGPKEAMQSVRNHVLSSAPECQRPLDTLDSELAWLEKIKQAVNEENLFQLLYERDLQKVRKGILTMSNAIKNDARIRAFPTYELYRYQRSFYESNKEKFSKIKKTREMAQREEENWFSSHQDVIQRARMEFSNCNLPDIR